MGSAPKDTAREDTEFDGFVTSVLAASWLLVGLSARTVEGFDGRTTLTQFRTMAVLSRRGGINLSRLAVELGVNVSTAMRSVDRLIGFGYATREENPQTRREVVLCLTPLGEQFVASVVERRRSEVAQLLEAVPRPSRESLVSGLRAFVAAGEQAGIRLAGPAALGW
ncbi:MAG TPA: MarR family transcriptional regulator [Mycobacteriales bacterium]|jgi:DNA-binding MarR family transcriptional regulator|nr:MarR family transcriptional regulator [Mycobacteriales bacterium]